jgi:cell division protein FtsQ
MSTGASALRRVRLRPLRLSGPRRHVRLAVAVSALVAALLGGGWLLVRDSALVAVDHVTVTGASGADAAAIDRALAATARRMTTLDVQAGTLRRAVARFASVQGLRVSTHFPHGMVIHVIQRVPVGLVEVDGRRVAVTADGRLLSGVAPRQSLPLISLAEPPSGRRLTRPGALGATRLLGAAPYQLLGRCATVAWQAGHGLVVRLRGGPSIYFGQASQVAAKWAAAVAVLASPTSAGAAYIDVTDPARPAAGS